jgi:hypothetical protein
MLQRIVHEEERRARTPNSYPCKDGQRIVPVMIGLEDASLDTS